MATFKCTGRCGQERLRTDFGTKGDGTRRSRCRECTAADTRDRYAARKASPRPVLADGPNLHAFDGVPDEIDDVPTTPIRFDVSDVRTEQIDEVQEHRLRTRVRELEAANRKLVADLSDARLYNDIAAQAVDARATAATIEPREIASGLREATALILASDWHVEEEVRPEQVAGRNRYNLEISAHRMQRFYQSARWAIAFNRQAFTIRDAVLWFGGDFLTNYLHPDNIESNLLSPVQTLAYLHESHVAGIRHLLDDPEIERLIIPCNDGNHGRLTDKMRSSTRVANSLEWLLYRQLADTFKSEPRVEFRIAAGEQLYMDIYGRSVRFTHGDSVRYGGGVGGVTIPIYKALARWDTVRRADLTCMGHFHQLTQLRDLIINGSLIGYGPYSLSIGARFEPPAQAFTILEPRRFNSVSMPLWVSEVEDDGAYAEAS